ncbi:SRPBCC family protein [Acanthopleuribacter pedis]|uniref:SRPBCC family protein n=1 Tax=Acanthopleuribacter pedis TaxID=442870 RepID=A0A8J7QKU4_9BACT|nr:SRPBCC family protein [Acanthopleuribacter pedis]MBO1320078.1 SRPBCC family protein [Acanthopleuribacter pedis]
MKVVKIVLGGLVAALLFFVAFLVFVAPSDFSVARSIEISAPKAYVFPAVNKLKNWKHWMIWAERDPNMEITYSGPDTGIGSKSAWQSESQGSGEMECLATELDKSVTYRLYFPDFDMASEVIMKVEEVSPEVTRVTWLNEGDVGGNPINKLFAMNMDSMVGPDFEAGLSNMKKWVESKPEALEADAAPAKIESETPAVMEPPSNETDQKEGQPVDK